MSVDGFAPLSRTLPYWPEDLLGRPAFLDEVGLSEFQVQEGDDTLAVSGTVLWYRELAVDVPGLPGVSFALLNEDEHTAVPFEADILPSPVFRLPSLTVSLRFAQDLLRRVRRGDDGRWVPDTDAQGQPRPAEVRLEGIGVQASLEGFDLLMPAGAPSLSLGPVQVGDTGVVLEVEGLTPYFSATQPPPTGAPPGFRGVALDQVRLHLPEGLDVPLAPSELSFEGLRIGTGGFSGTIRGQWTPQYDPQTRTYSGSGAGSLFGIAFALKDLSLGFEQNVPTTSALHGELVLPFFEQPVAVEISLAARGGLAVQLAAVQPAGVNVPRAGLIEFEKEDLLKLSVDSFGFAVDAGVFTVRLGGRVQPLAGGLEWPGFEVKDLSIDSEGNVRLEGGWLDLRDQYALDFHGFRVEVTRLGFGKTEDGGKWIGVSGGVKLVEALPAGASVDGLRVTWYEDGSKPVAVTFSGVGVEFEVPDVMRFKGAVSYSGPMELPTPLGVERVERFDGAIKLELVALDLQIDANLVIGSATGPRGAYTFFAIYVSAELPAGIPLWSTGLALYGMAGLFALNMEPNRGAPPNPLHPGSRVDEGWYENPDGSPGWYKRDVPGVTDLRSKWDPRKGSLALGAGVTIGTVADNGFTFAAKTLLVIVFPGPILLIEGKANLLRERAGLDEEPVFRALAVLDNRAGHLLVGLDAQYRYAEGGELIDIRGGAEVFFDFHRADAWHLYLGRKDPRERRIRAEIFKLFQANAYFMLDAHRLAMGAWIGYNKRYKFGPLRVTLEAWAEGNALVSFKPAHFSGDLWLHGKAELRAWKFGLGLQVDANIEAEVFDPFHVLGRFRVEMKLPWPFPDVGGTIELEWGPEPTPPPLPVPLQEVAVEHFKVTTSWPLPRGELLLPVWDRGDGFLRDSAEGGAEPDDALVPVVPLDARPHLTFGRAVHDDARVGVNAQPVSPEWERIGDPAKDEGPVRARFGLKRVELHRRGEAGWVPVAQTPETAHVPRLYGSWAPVPRLPDGGGENVGQTKLWLWSKTPFDYTRHSGRAWNEWFGDRNRSYPCVEEGEPTLVCCALESLDLTPVIPSGYAFNGDVRGSIGWGGPSPVTVTTLGAPVDGLTRALCIPLRVDGRWNEITIHLWSPADAVRLTFADTGVVDAEAYDQTGKMVAWAGGSPGARYLDLRGAGIRKVVIHERIIIGIAARDQVDVSSAAGSEDREAVDTILRSRAEIESGSSSIEGETGATGISAESGDEAVVSTEDGGERFAAPVAETEGDVAAFAPGDQACLVRVRVERGGATFSADFQHPDPIREVPMPWRCAQHPEVGFDRVYEPGLRFSSVLRVLPQPVDGKTVALCFGQQIIITIAGTGEGGEEEKPEIRAAAPDDQFWADFVSVELTRPTEGLRLTVVHDSGVRATAYDREGTAFGPFYGGTPADPHVDVVGEGIVRVVLAADVAGEIRVLEVCFADVDTLTRHISDELARWAQEGEVLEPFTRYRLTVVTEVRAEGEGELDWFDRTQELVEHAYFRTEGPPGLAVLSRPVGHPNPDEFTSGVDDLTRYVRQTVPPTVPAAGERPLVPRPVYRAYDVGVEFNENYTELMYRAAGRDLGLYLYDNNNRPVRDAAGRLVAATNRWGRAEQLTLTESEERWLMLVTARECIPVQPPEVLRDSTLVSAGEAQVLLPDTVYEARLVPLLLHEDFAGFAPGQGAGSGADELRGWQAPGAGYWEIGEDGTPPSRWVAQRTAAESVLLRADLPGAEAGGWTDYRLGVYVRFAAAAGSAGAVVRWADAGTHWRVVLDAAAGASRLVRVSGGQAETVDERAGALEAGRDYLLTVEALGDTLRVYVDGELRLEAGGVAPAAGRAGLYAAGAEGARFSDVRVDDFRAAAPVAYRFGFTTSRFADFFHQLHSHDGEVWPAPVADDADVAGWLAAAVSPAAEVTEGESRAYEAAASAALGAGAGQGPASTEVLALEHAGAVPALLVRSPEPIDWRRTTLSVLRPGRALPAPSVPAALKLAGAAFSAGPANDEHVTVLLREAGSLAGYRLEHRPLDAPDAEWEAYYEFGASEPPLAAGTQVRVHAGSADEAPEPEAGVERRFAAARGDAGAPKLGTGVEVRLVAPDGQVAHRRGFLPPADYTPASGIRVLRKADGTGFVLAADGPLAPGATRLELVFARDNRAADPESLVLRRAGSTAPERVVLDVG